MDTVMLKATAEQNVLPDAQVRREPGVLPSKEERK
jgi:hypothetical protein